MLLLKIIVDLVRVELTLSKLAKLSFYGKKSSIMELLIACAPLYTKGPV